MATVPAFKHTPATPLPWQAVQSDVRGYGNPRGIVYSDDDTLPQDAAYIAHAANAYPRLVEALRAATEISVALHHLAVNGHLLSDDWRRAMVERLVVDVPSMYDRAKGGDDLLRELGEAS